MNIHYQLGYGGADQNQGKQAENNGQDLQDDTAVLAAPPDKNRNEYDQRQIDHGNGTKLEKAVTSIFCIAEILG